MPIRQGQRSEKHCTCVTHVKDVSKRLNVDAKTFLVCVFWHICLFFLLFPQGIFCFSTFMCSWSVRSILWENLSRRRRVRVATFAEVSTSMNIHKFVWFYFVSFSFSLLPLLFSLSLFKSFIFPFILPVRQSLIPSLTLQSLRVTGI